MEIKVDLSKIRLLRKKGKISQIAMALALGYKTATGYSYLESGRCAIGANQIPIIAKMLHVEVHELYMVTKMVGNSDLSLGPTGTD